MEKRLYRDTQHKAIAGVCAGLANYLNIDVTIVRIFFVLAALLKGAGIPIYIVLWIVMPKRDIFIDPNVDYTVPPANPFSSNPFANQPPVNDPYVNDPYVNDPFKNQPFAPLQPRKPSTVAVVIGTVLILIGGFILIDYMVPDLDIDFDKFWPIILVAGGIGLILSGRRKHNHHEPFTNAEEIKAEENNNPSTEE